MTIDSASALKGPTIFEIAMLAAQLPKGKRSPEEQFMNAINHYWRARHALERYDDMVSDHEDNVAREMEQRQFSDEHVIFRPSEDWDPMREYLHTKGIKIKGGETLCRNFRKYLKATGDEETLKKMKSALSTRKPYFFPKAIADDFVRHKKALKSEGGKKSYQTRKTRCSQPTVKM